MSSDFPHSSPQVQIEIHISRDPRHGAGVSVLPQVKVVVKIGLLVVLGQPQGVVGEFSQVIVKIPQILIEVNGGLKARLGNFGAEGRGALGKGLPGQALGTGVLPPGDGLPVKGDGV